MGQRLQQNKEYMITIQAITTLFECVAHPVWALLEVMREYKGAKVLTWHPT